MPFDQPLPSYLSPSRLGDFQSCPRRYQYASIERRPQPSSYALVKGRLAHELFERLFALPGDERTAARTLLFLPDAEAAVLTETVRDDIGLTDALLAKLRRELRDIVTTYFTMEDPRHVVTEGVERRITAELAGAPVLGILDRLDREADGSLSIVDYKTGAVPSRAYLDQAFANTEIYALLCAAATGETPRRLRLLYVTHGEPLERPITPQGLAPRERSIGDAWRRITRYYADDEFPATPSASACRFCAYRAPCRESGVGVPGR